MAQEKGGNEPQGHSQKVSEPGSNPGLTVPQEGKKAYEGGICHPHQAGTRDLGEGGSSF